jgi:hypothetical protein
VLEICFVLARRQNAFFFELAEALCDELSELGHPTSISTEGFPPPREDLVYVLLPPHEYYALEGIKTEPTWQVLKRTVFICTEQPGTQFFDKNVFFADRAGVVFDISRTAIEEFARHGVPGVRELPLGWTRTWSPVDFSAASEHAEEERDIDVLHLGVHSAKRARDLAANGPWLWHLGGALILSEELDGPNHRDTANFASRERKWDLLTRSRVLLNLHQAELPYFEWLRVVQAIGAGCVVVSEHSLDYEPIVPGEHVLFGRPDALGLLAQELIEDESRRLEMARAAWLMLKEQRPMSGAARLLSEAAEEVSSAPLPPDGRAERFRKPSAELARPSGREQFPSPVKTPAESALRAAAKDIRLDLLGLRRQLALSELRAALGEEPPSMEHVAATPAWSDATPRVSFIVALYDHAEHVQRALDSAARSRFDDIEIVVTDDGSNDGSGMAVSDWMSRSRDVAALLVRHPVNRGTGAARNTALELARGEFVFILDADNEVYPTAIGKVLDAMAGDPEAVLAYGMLEMFAGHGAVGLRSCFPWGEDRFRRGNPIDAMALVRRDWLMENGGYTTDIRLHGWEDYDLWCRVAERGFHGVLVPEIVARYRTSEHSVLSITDISSRQAVALLIDRHPRLMRGVVPPL